MQISTKYDVGQVVSVVSYSWTRDTWKALLNQEIARLGVQVSCADHEDHPGDGARYEVGEELFLEDDVFLTEAEATAEAERRNEAGVRPG